MTRLDDELLARQIAGAVQPLTGTSGDLDDLVAQAAAVRCVLIGDATHGTREMHALRTHLSRRLIVEAGFTAVAIEGDWGAAYQVNRFVQGAGAAQDAAQALAGFRHFPAWVWRNTEVRDFVTWLRAHNQRQGAAVGFHGLDLYGLHASVAAVLGHLDRVAPEAALRARYRYACFEQVGEAPELSGYVTSLGLEPERENELLARLVELRHRRWARVLRQGLLPGDAPYESERDARLAAAQDAYYRAMLQGRVSSWNLRERHLADSLEALLRRTSRGIGSGKVIVWAHNTHVGDARASQRGQAGEVSLGQLVRERHAGDCFLIGFTSHSGTVTAAADWGGPAELTELPPAGPRSYEELFHRCGLSGFLLRLHEPGEVTEGLRISRAERATGAVYRPLSERGSQYVHCCLPEQYDALIHIDRSRAVQPLAPVVESPQEAGREATPPIP
jgi:erythromycin esterase-like protein